MWASSESDPVTKRRSACFEEIQCAALFSDTFHNTAAIFHSTAADAETVLDLQTVSASHLDKVDN